jgi:hypothetical protein
MWEREGALIICAAVCFRLRIPVASTLSGKVMDIIYQGRIIIFADILP